MALMRAHAARGERGMAIQAYDRCRAVLAEMLDAAPSQETQALLNQIRGPSSKRLPPRPPAAVAGAGGRGPRRARTGGRTTCCRAPVRGSACCRCAASDLPDDIAWLGPSLANEITTALSRFRWMSVISVNSLARFAQGRRRRFGAEARRRQHRFPSRRRHPAQPEQAAHHVAAARSAGRQSGGVGTTVRPRR